MSVSISFDPHRGKPIVEDSKISNLRTENCFDALVKTDVDLPVCSASVQVAGPHAKLQIVLSAVVTSELMLSSQQPQSSHRTFLPVLLPRPRSAKCHLREARYRASGFVLWPDPEASATGPQVRYRRRSCRGNNAP
jgi:hypothetical protein